MTTFLTHGLKDACALSFVLAILVLPAAVSYSKGVRPLDNSYLLALSTAQAR